MQIFEFDSSDLAATEEFLARAYTKMRIGGDNGQTRTRIARRWLGGVSADDVAFSYDMSYDANPLERILVCRVHKGRIEQRIDGGPSDVFAPGDVTLVSFPEMPFSGRVCQASYDLTMFDPAELNRIASTDGRDGGQVRLTGHRPVSAAAGTQLSATISYLREQLMPGADAAPSALVESTATAHFAAAVLNAFPNNAVTEPTALDRKDARPILLRRAIAFVDDNAHTEISLADIAAHVYVTPRTVQYLFRRHLDCTPMEYIRRVRMHHAHRELVMADPVSTTVTRVANKWGFAHTGRFAVRYRQMFGQSPHETLRGA